jgi:hypothetical protein
MALGKLAGDDLNGKVEDVTFADCVDIRSINVVFSLFPPSE